MEENEVILQDLPTSVRGFVFQGEDGEPVIVVNSQPTGTKSATSNGMN